MLFSVCQRIFRHRSKSACLGEKKTARLDKKGRSPPFARAFFANRAVCKAKRGSAVHAQGLRHFRSESRIKPWRSQHKGIVISHKADRPKRTFSYDLGQHGQIFDFFFHGVFCINKIPKTDDDITMPAFKEPIRLLNFAQGLVVQPLWASDFFGGVMRIGENSDFQGNRTAFLGFVLFCSVLFCFVLFCYTYYIILSLFCKKRLIRSKRRLPFRASGTHRSKAKSTSWRCPY